MLRGHRAQGLVKIAGFIQRGQFRLIGKDNIHRFAANQLQKLGSEALDTKGIRQGDRHAVARRMGNVRGLEKGLFGRRLIPEIAFEIGDGTALHQGGFNILRGQILAGTEIGVHRTLPVRRDKDKGAGAGRPVHCGWHIKGHAGFAQVMRKHRPDRIRLDLANIGGADPQIGNAHHCIGGRTAGDDHRLRHAGIKILGARLINQVHCPFDDGLGMKKTVIGCTKHIDNGIANAKNLE